MNSSAVLNLIVALGGGSLVGTIITLLFKRGVTRAESEQIQASATEVIARTASKAAKDISEQYASMNEGIRRELAECKSENHSIKAQLSTVEGKLDRAIGMLEHLGQDTSTLR